MKKFKHIESFAGSKLTGKEMFSLTGGMMSIPKDKGKTRNPNTGIYDDDGCIPRPFPFPNPPIIIF